MTAVIMRKIFFLCVAIAIVGAAVPSANAKTYIGPGGRSCSEYLEFTRSAPDMADSIDLWILGYVSGLNFMTYSVKKVDLLRAQEYRDVISFVKGYCSTNPEKTLNNAANEFWIHLSRRSSH